MVIIYDRDETDSINFVVYSLRSLFPLFFVTDAPPVMMNDADDLSSASDAKEGNGAGFVVVVVVVVVVAPSVPSRLHDDC